MNFFKSILVALGIIALMGISNPASADKLDDVIKSGMLNCGVVADFPPMGYIDKNNEPAGFDVDYCKDLAKQLGVKVKIHNLTWGDRIPSLISGKTDVVVGSTSDTLERAKSVGFTYPYFVFKFQVISKKNSGIKKFDDLRNLRVGAPLGTTYETEYLAYAEKKGWGKSNYTAFKSENDGYLALYQGKIDALISTNTNIATKLATKEFKDYVAGPFVPDYDDIVGLIARRNELAWIQYLNLFLIHQIRDGRFDELHMKYFNTPASPEMIKSLRDNK